MRVVLPLVACSCIEYDVGQDLPNPPVPNPPVLENPTQTDVIVQVTTPMVDVLWTIDNSCSMADEQDALGDNFPKFMDYFLGSGLDYHIGVTSTDIDDPAQKGKLQTGGTPYKYIDEDTPNAINVFVAMASMGTTGSANEKGLGGTYLALETNRDTFNAGFYRDDASIHTIVLSDESDNTPASIVTENEFISWYDGLKPEADERTFSSVVDFNVGGVYTHITNEIGGIVWDVHDDNYSEVLDRLGIQAAGLKREYFLSQIPVPGTITVKVEDPSGATFEFFEAVGDPPAGDWTYSSARNSITFLTYIPDELAKIVISYTIQSSTLEGEDGVADDETPATP